MKVVAYKAFEHDWTCKGHKFDVGKTYEFTGEIKLCESGFHACTNPADLQKYYELGYVNIGKG